jgi:hypothetical protein
MKIMVTAILVGAVGVYALIALRPPAWTFGRFHVGGVLLEAVLFGIGLAILGYCPGTGMAGSGEGAGMR